MLRTAFTALGRAFQKKPPHSRVFAAELDFRSACPLLELNEKIISGLRNEDEIRDALLDLNDKWATEKLSNAIPFANDSITIQLAEIFQHIHDIDSGDTPTPVRLPRLSRDMATESAAFQPTIGPSTHTNPRPTLNFQMKAMYDESVVDSSIDLNYQLEQRVGYAPWIGPTQSPTDQHRAGVYLRGKASPGAVVAAYPGAVYNGEMLQKAIDCGHLANPKALRHLVPRFDEAVIDCFAANAPKLNPYAVAHHVRHPPPGVMPNVMRIQYDFIDSHAVKKGFWDSLKKKQAQPNELLPFPAHLRDYIPNVWGTNIVTGQALYSALEQNVWMKGSVLIALREIWNEELFLDHTLNPYALQAKTVPPWALDDYKARKPLRSLEGRTNWDTVAATRQAMAEYRLLAREQRNQEKALKSEGEAKLLGNEGEMK